MSTGNQKLRVVIHSMGMPFDGNTLKTASLGGSETAAYYQALELAKRGHYVELWTCANTDEWIDGVKYTPIGNVTPQAPLGEKFERHVVSTPCDVLIIQRHPLAFHKKWAAKVCIWQLHDLALHRSTGAIWQGLWQTDVVTCVSEWHRQQVLDVYGIKPSAVRVVPNGVDPGVYEQPELGTEIARKLLGVINVDHFIMLYQSRPERGLEHLVRPGGIMDRLRDTTAHLLICGYANTRPEVAAQYHEWEQMAAALSNVTNLGALTKRQLAALQKSCDLLVYPTEFEEVSCITAMEAMHAGLPMISSRVGALHETCDSHGSMLIPLEDGKVDEGQFAQTLRSFIGEPLNLEGRKEAQLQAAKSKTWACAVDTLEALMTECMERSRTDQRLIRHGFEHSDLQIARHGMTSATPADYRESDLYAFSESTAGYAAHYEKHQGKYYDEFEDKVIGEDVTGTTRFRAIMNLLAIKQDAMQGQQLRMLDYGCAHGHYLMQFAKWLPASEFFGIDISDRAIAAALKWAMKERIHNVTLGIGGLEHLAGWTQSVKAYINDRMDATTGDSYAEEILTDNRLDVILAGEVLEHVPDPARLMGDLCKHLKPGGILIGTTPVGRWEWTGTEAFRTAREHLWHFERGDIEEMLQGMEHEILYAPAGHDRTGGPLGSYVWSVAMPEQPPRFLVPYSQDRLNRVVPRQTISACLIVKNAERSIRKCVESFVDWVDQIVIGIDPTTTDRTPELLKQLSDDYPLKEFVIFEGGNATLDGFAAARNQTLDKATGDWILWLDADEELQQPWTLWKFAKESAIDGFGLPQVHYSCNPPQVLTTDFPTRFFRRSCGARFHGLVHEHPEVKMGEAVPYTVVRHDAQFLHSGYVDEETRRRRYARNYPLLLRDLEANPDRTINKFLALRDLAQGVMFELEQTGGYLTHEMEARLHKCIEVYEKLLDEKSHVRMLVDGLEYYSPAVAALNLGFDFDVTLKVNKPPFDALGVSTQVKGRFRTRELYLKFLTRLSEESTKHYESKHL